MRSQGCSGTAEIDVGETGSAARPVDAGDRSETGRVRTVGWLATEFLAGAIKCLRGFAPEGLRSKSRETRMLIEFCAENHRAIREKQIFSMVPAPADVIDRQEAPDHVVETGHSEIPRLLIDACLFGANGSGKTSLIAAMDFMVRFVGNSADSETDEKIPVEPFIHSPDWKGRPSEFEATFIFDGAVYQYGFAVTQDHVQGEWLSVLPKNSSEWIALFERERSSKGGDYESWTRKATQRRQIRLAVRDPSQRAAAEHGGEVQGRRRSGKCIQMAGRAFRHVLLVRCGGKLQLHGGPPLRRRLEGEGSRLLPGYGDFPAWHQRRREAHGRRFPA